MQKIINPDINQWETLCKRPAIDTEDVNGLVQQIFKEIKQNGDTALKKYTQLFDGSNPDAITVSKDETTAAIAQVPDELKAAIQLAKANIEKFHEAQAEQKQIIETITGVQCWRESRAIEKVGIYIPGGSAPLFSTVLMLAVPATLAGCKEIVLCSPPDKQGNINPAILYAAQLSGVTAIYKAGGIQAIGAIAFGTQSIAKVDKIFGPGNQYVTAAKQAAFANGVAIDLPAGPSELLVIADATANPEFVAADLLSQAEHGADSQVVLVSDNEALVNQTIQALEVQVAQLPRKDIVLKALQNSRAIVLNGTQACIDFSNAYAPEHLIIATADADFLAERVISAGSVFIGNYSCESAGDYASGTNHTLPTNGYARSYSGVSLDSFVKKITFQKITPRGLQNIGPAIEIMAAAESLDAHKNAVTIRLNTLKNV
ncbi:histidinol dehydrogenase [Flavobacterium psychrotrophum]|uniref:histidinol dehydrogenase n=1 Tax=Flavobacterium psychrotrophum TaxID=2294119 RepID=UPI000E319714|nr:histidinol dehydrogenase [Flavobacterium psychrotrophum]